jgi:protein O-mannosyl-transferase
MQVNAARDRLAEPGVGSNHLLANGSRRWQLLPVLVSAAIALAAYAVTLHGTLVYDDLILHIDRRYATPALWKYFWIKQYWPGGIDNLYRPLACMTLAAQYWLHGELAWPYHLVNILLHAGVSAAVAELARRLLNLRAAWIAGMLFAIHPIHVEVVAWIIGRLELLSTLFTLIAIAVFLRPLSGRRIIAIAGLFLAAVLSKEQGLLLPPMILALVPFRKKILNFTSENQAGDKEQLKRLAGILLLLLGGYLIFRESILRFWWPRWMMYWVTNPLVLSTGVDRVLMPVVLLGRYTQLLIAPVYLSVDYGSMVIGWQVSYRDPYLYIGFAALLVWLVLLVVSVRRRNWAIFFLLIALGLSYVMVGNVVSLIGTNFGERLMYMPSAFFLMIVAAYAARLRTAALAPAMAALLVVGALRTVSYARLWDDPLQLYLAALEHSPRSLKLYDLVREQYEMRHDMNAAREIGHRCIKNLPEVWDAYALCLDVDMKAGDYDDAAAVAALGVKNCPVIEMQLWQKKVAQARKAAALTTLPATSPTGERIQN